MQSTTDKPFKAHCSFHLSEEELIEYISISDYAAKRGKVLFSLILSIVIVMPILILSAFIGFPIQFTIAFAFFTLYQFPFYLLSLVTKRPPLWQFRFQRRGIVAMYKEAFGYKRDEEVSEWEFIIEDEELAFGTERRMLRVPLDWVRWVRRSGDLVVVGCLNGWSTLTSAILGPTDRNHYEPCPAAAFLASRLEGMDADELIGILKQYAKKSKPIKWRNATWQRCVVDEEETLLFQKD